MEAQDVAGLVRRARRVADLSQRELAARVGVAQSHISNVEGGRSPDVATFLQILDLAGLRITVIDQNGDEVAPMPDDVLRDRVGRRMPAHLDVYAAPERVPYRMLLRGGDLFPDAWFHHRADRDRMRARYGRSATDEQPTVSSRARVRARRRYP
ncbi:MAG TPA: helix-turn-helix transcriptional regulator [Microbacterium sp.]|nr:helix-turn-helix transcriptional regulator [Microbacterium sp.]